MVFTSLLEGRVMLSLLTLLFNDMLIILSYVAPTLIYLKYQLGSMMTMDYFTLHPPAYGSLCSWSICFFLHGFFQCSYIYNASGSLLDLFFSNVNCISTNLSSCETVVPADFYHPPLVIFYIGNFNSIHFGSTHSLCNFKYANYNNIIKFLSLYDWPSTSSSLDTDIATNVFLGVLWYFPSFPNPCFKVFMWLMNYRHFFLLCAK